MIEISQIHLTPGTFTQDLSLSITPMRHHSIRASSTSRTTEDYLSLSLSYLSPFSLYLPLFPLLSSFWLWFDRHLFRIIIGCRIDNVPLGAENKNAWGWDSAIYRRVEKESKYDYRRPLQWSPRGSMQSDSPLRNLTVPVSSVSIVHHINNAVEQANDLRMILKILIVIMMRMIRMKVMRARR